MLHVLVLHHTLAPDRINVETMSSSCHVSKTYSSVKDTEHLNRREQNNVQ